MLELTNKSEDESASNDLSVRADLAGKSRHETPCDGEEPQVPRGSAAVVEKQVGRHLHEDLDGCQSQSRIHVDLTFGLTYATKRILRPT